MSLPHTSRNRDIQSDKPTVMGFLNITLPHVPDSLVFSWNEINFKTSNFVLVLTAYTGVTACSLFGKNMWHNPCSNLYANYKLQGLCLASSMMYKQTVNAQ